MAKTRPERPGDFVRRTRTAKRLSLADVSKRSARCGRRIAASYINKIERNPKLTPSANKLTALALGLGIPAYELLEHAVREMTCDEAKRASLLARFRELSPSGRLMFGNPLSIGAKRRSKFINLD